MDKSDVCCKGSRWHFLVLPIHTSTSPALTRATAPPRSRIITPDSASYKWWVTATVMLSAFLVVVSGAAMNVALPPIMTTFGLNLDQAQWILTAYMIAGAVLIPTVGWLGNRLGNRNLFLLSLLIFVGSSMLCGIAWSGPTLIFFRVLQGIGSGPITPMAMVFLNEAFPAKQRGLAMGLYGMAVSFWAGGRTRHRRLCHGVSELAHGVLYESRARAPVHGAGVPGDP